MKFALLHSDNHLLVVSKKGGMLTQPNETGEPSLVECAKEWIKERYEKKGNIFLHPIHRLDAPTSGIVLLARTSKALSRLNEDMRERRMEKTYLTVIPGSLKEKEGNLVNWHEHGSFKAIISNAPTKEGKKAHLHYQTLEEKEGYSLLQIKLYTGRYHQIRAQFAFIGYPIVGDQKYGCKLALPGNVIALHHSHFTFFHPITHEKLHFTAPLPPIWPFQLKVS